jgi:putative membrane protein
MSEESKLPKKDANQLAEERTELASHRTTLAIDRNRLALERTLMAWIRTSVSLISFGFSIYKVFQSIFEIDGEIKPGLISPRDIGIIMLLLGFLGILFATIQHRRDLKILKDMNPNIKLPKSISGILAYFIILLSFTLLIVAVFRL